MGETKAMHCIETKNHKQGNKCIRTSPALSKEGTPCTAPSLVSVLPVPTPAQLPALTLPQAKRCRGSYSSSSLYLPPGLFSVRTILAC